MKMSPTDKLILFTALFAGPAPAAIAQTASAAADAPADNAWMFIAGVVVLICIGGFVAWKVARKEKTVEPIAPHRKRVTYEWKPEIENSSPADSGRTANGQGSSANPSLQGVDIVEVKERMEKIRYSRLPINRLGSPGEPKPFKELPASLEDELMEAIEDSDCEFVDDEAVREAALDVLAKHKTSNSVEAISQAALYDVSSALRSKAVAILADFDHESVFETVILSCADPAREVRAAAARSLFRLTFSRAEAWHRISCLGDQYRMSQVAKAAIEADFVDRSIERLVHEDANYAREALALLTLLIRAGEADDLFDYLRQGEDLNTKLAILKTFEFVRDDAALDRLAQMSMAGEIPSEIASEAKSLVAEKIPTVV